MKFKFEKVTTYIVEAFDLDDAEAKMGEEDYSDYEVNSELDYKGEVK